MFTEKVIDNKNTNKLDVFFGYAAFTPLYKSNLINNDLYAFYEDFTIGNIKDIDIPINIDKDKTVRIWSSRNNTQEYLNFLYFCYKLPNQISVIFANEYNRYVNSVGETVPEEIKELLKYEHKLTDEEKDMRYDRKERNALIEDYPSQITGGMIVNREFILHFRHVFTIYLN